MRKKRACAGEALAEMLVSIFIISMGMLMLSGAVICAARVNHRAERTLNPVSQQARPMEFEALDLSGKPASHIRVQGADGEFTIEINVNEYGGDFFYEKAR